MNFNTKLLHGKPVIPYANGATVPQIAQTSAFSYDSAETHEKVFHHQAPGFAYTRVANPTVAAFENRINELDGGIAASATASGMAAIALAFLNVLSAGDEIIAGRTLYGGTLDLFRDLSNFGITTKYVDKVCTEEIAPLITDNTKVIFGELISNPSQDVMDVRAVADLAHEHGIPLYVDATTVTPYLCQPLKLGADIVIHSTSKYINGGGNSISGIIVDGGTFKWTKERYPAMAPFLKYGKMAFTIRLQTDVRENMGACLAPFNAYLNVVGLETLGLRMQRICDNAKALANALNEIEGVEVNYAGLANGPYAQLIADQFRGNAGGILTFRVGSKERAFKILNALKCVVIASNIGDTRTLAIHPASTLYINSTKENTELAGVFDDTIRVSVGIEDPEDLIEDFKQAIAAAE